MCVCIRVRRSICVVTWRVCMCLCVCACVCILYCVSMAPLREVSVVASHSTACQLWFSCGAPPGPTFGTQRKYTSGTCSHRLWTHLSTVCVRVCILDGRLCGCVIVSVRTCNGAELCCTLCPLYFKAFWPHDVMSARGISRLQSDEQSERTQTEGRKGWRNEERGKQSG